MSNALLEVNSEQDSAELPNVNTTVPDQQSVERAGNVLSHAFTINHINNHVFNTSAYKSFIKGVSYVPLIGNAFQIADGLLETITGNKSVTEGFTQVGSAYATFNTGSISSLESFFNSATGGVSGAATNTIAYNLNSRNLIDSTQNTINQQFKDAGLLGKKVQQYGFNT